MGFGLMFYKQNMPLLITQIIFQLNGSKLEKKIYLHWWVDNFINFPYDLGWIEIRNLENKGDYYDNLRQNLTV